MRLQHHQHQEYPHKRNPKGKTSARVTPRLFFLMMMMMVVISILCSSAIKGPRLSPPNHHGDGFIRTHKGGRSANCLLFLLLFQGTVVVVALYLSDRQRSLPGIESRIPPPPSSFSTSRPTLLIRYSSRLLLWSLMN